MLHQINLSVWCISAFILLNWQMSHDLVGIRDDSLHLLQLGFFFNRHLVFYQLDWSLQCA
jgi:hypothetical protein